MDRIVKRAITDLKAMIKSLEDGYKETEKKEGIDLILSPMDIRMLFSAQSNIAVVYENLQYYRRLRETDQKDIKTLTEYIKQQSAQAEEIGKKQEDIQYV